MKDWREVALGDLCSRVTVGHVGKMAKEYVQEGVPFLRSQNVKPFSISVEGMLEISAEFHRRLSKSTLRTGDVVVVRTGYPGTAAVIPPELDGSNCADLVVITPSEMLNPHMVAAIFNSEWGRSAVGGQLVGSAQQHFNIGSAKALRVRLPDRHVQDRIAAVLCTLGDLLDNNRRRIELLEKMTQAIYQEWFVRFRYPGCDDVALVDSRLGPIPDGWEVCQLREIATVVRGRSYRKYELVDVGGVPFVNLKCMMRGGGFRRDGLKRYEGTYTPDQQVREGDIVLAVTDLTQGREILARATVVPRLEGEFGVISLDVVRIVPKYLQDHVAMFMSLRFTDFADRVKEFANGSTVLHLSPTHVGDNELVWPAEKLRRRFDPIVEPMLRQVNHLYDAAERLAAIRDLLLPRLVSGQIDVSDLDHDSLAVPVT